MQSNPKLWYNFSSEYAAKDRSLVRNKYDIKTSSSEESLSSLLSAAAANGTDFGGNAFAPFCTFIHNIHHQ